MIGLHAHAGDAVCQRMTLHFFNIGASDGVLSDIDVVSSCRLTWINRKQKPNFSHRSWWSAGR